MPAGKVFWAKHVLMNRENSIRSSVLFFMLMQNQM